MDFTLLARVVHIVCVVLWIGGVSMVTTVMIPVFKNMPRDVDGLKTFHAIEKRFAAQARVTTLLTAMSGVIMLEMTHSWSRFLDPGNWWLYGMVTIWVLFSIMLFIIEPFVLPRVVAKLSPSSTRNIFPAMLLLHIVLLAGSLITIAGAVSGSHGGLF
ncbi:MAG: hypothetical protein HQL77_10950 [Magnetococcales bacterium]|nr:hypothetical protein [Magnetococcales bacterium]